MDIDDRNPTTYIKTKVKHKQEIKWWTKPEYNVHLEIFGVIRDIKQKWSPQYQDLVGHMRRYEDRSYSYIYEANPYSKTIANQIISLNVTASCIDTLTSKIIKNVPTVQYLTNGADYETQEKANDLQKFILGRFRNEKVHDITPIVFKDACTFGDGFVHCKIKDDRVIYEITKSYEIFIDWYDGLYGNPIDLHIVKWKNRYDVLLEFPEFENDILMCPTDNDIFVSSSMGNDNILVVESYNRFAKRHAVSISNKTLLDEPWELENVHGDFQYPIARMCYKPADRNFFNIGLAEELKSIQFEVNRLVRVLQRASNLGTVPKIFVPRGANVIKSHMDNDIGGMIMYDGPQPPISMPMMTIPTDLYTQIIQWKNNAFEIAGISQLTASSQKPAGLNSGKALETYYEIESDRFQYTGQQYENLMIQLNDVTLGLMKIVAKKNGGLKSTFYSPDLQKNIDWDDVEMERDQFDMQVFPVNMLPNTPEGKFSFVQEMLQSGMIDPVYAKKLLRIPDTDGYLDLQNAEVDYVLCQISKMVRGEEQEPDVNQNFDLAKDLVQKAYFYYTNKNLNPKHLLLFDRYLQTIERLIVVKTAQTMNLLQQAQQLQAQNTGVNSYGTDNSATGIPAAAVGPAGDATNVQ